MQARPLASPPEAPRPGLFRTALVGRPARLTEAFAMLPEGPCWPPASTALAPRVQASKVPSGESGAWEMINLQDQVFVVASDCEYREPRSEQVLAEGFVEFHFTLAGGALATTAPAGRTVVRAMDLVVCCLGDQASYTVHCEIGRRRSVALYVRRGYFERFLDRGTASGALLHQLISGIQPTDAYIRRVPMGVGPAHLVTQIIDNPYRDARRWLFVQAKVDELLCESVDAWAAQARQRAGDLSLLSARDLARLQQARRLIVEDLGDALTIPEIARAVGINSSKLKAGFRALFGSTIHAYRTRARMERALELLTQETDLLQVALAVGYSHASTFSAAFRQFYGCPPDRARRAQVRPQTLPMSTEDGLSMRRARPTPPPPTPVSL